jgi:hypothetical protein
MSPDEGFTKWADIIGTWRLDEGKATYVRGAPNNGLLLGPRTLTNGEVRVQARLLVDADLEEQGSANPSEEQGDGQQGDPTTEPTSEVPGARIIFGYDIREIQAYSAGLGHSLTHYVVERLAPALGPGWNPIGFAGVAAPLEPGRDYQIELQLLGQRTLLKVDEIPVVDISLPAVPTGKQVGLMAWGPRSIAFTDFHVIERAPRLFVVMQFGPPLDSIYTDVIAPVGEAAGFDSRRGDDFAGPGQILADITRELKEASVVVAEISEANPNVYYEIGYAHAVGTPTILLARRGQPLPFDISGFRCIFYDDSIGGKQRVEGELRRHLAAITASTEHRLA